MNPNPEAWTANPGWEARTKKGDTPKMTDEQFRAALILEAKRLQAQGKPLVDKAWRHRGIGRPTGR
jgi:hypothetical protein